MTSYNRADICVHCKKPIGLSRSGRGLCRVCWNDKTTRIRYPLLATFGGDTRRIDRALDGKEPASC
jgi:hypothetical protein